MRKGLVFLLMVSLCVAVAGPASATYWFAASARSTGVYDEQANNVNAVDREVKAGSLAAFKVAVATAYANDTGGVADFTQLYDAAGNKVSTAGKYGTPSGAIGDPFQIKYGVSLSNAVTMRVPPTDHIDMFDVHTRKYNDSSINIPAISGDVVSNKYWADTLITSQRYATNPPTAPGTCRTGEMWWTFVEPKVLELGITGLGPLSNSLDQHAGNVMTLDVKATYSNGATETLSAAYSNLTVGLEDTFFYFKAPPGTTISRIDANDRDNDGLIAFDDLAVITGMPSGGAVPEPAGLGLLGVALLALRKRRS